MADLASGFGSTGPGLSLPGLGEQLRLVAWLRLRSLRNGLHNKNRRLDLVGTIASGIFSCLLVGGITIGLFVGTTLLVRQHQEGYFGLIFLGLLAWWQLFPILLAGFAAQFSFRSLLRFPMRFSAFYLLGLAYGFADAAALAALVWMLTMVVATTLAAPALAPVMLLACLLFAVLNVSIERLVGAWLEKLLAKRRAREVIFTVFILSMVSLQFLNPLLQKHGRAVKGLVEHAWPYLWILPSSFAGDFVARAGQGQWGAAAIRLAGLLGYLAIVSLALWQRYARLYAGEDVSEGVAPATREKPATRRKTDDRDSLAFLPPQILAVFRKETLYLKRNTFLFFSLVIPPLMIFFFSMQFAGEHPGAFKRGLSPDLFFPGMMAYLVLILIAPSYNSFAHEGRGIQTYFTSPVKFREILMAKNLMTVAIVFAELTFCVLLVGLRVGWPSTPVLLATLTAMVFSVVGQLTIANWSSISFPKKMEFGRMQGQRNSGMSVFLMLGVQLVLGGISAVILFSGRWTGRPWLPAEIFAFLAATTLAGYFSSLDALTALAEKKKEVLLEVLCR